MHTEYFGLERRPFEILPDSQFLFLSDQHDRAIANIRFALANKDCFVVITGEIGVGKTTILNTVLRTLDTEIEMARLVHTSLSPVELLQAVLLAFKEPVESDSKVLLFEQLRHFLLKKFSENKHVVLAVDEAQNLGSAALEELRLLTCIESDTKQLLTVVLMGQPALSELINTEQLYNLKQRIRLRQHLRRLTVEETFEYLEHRLSVVGGELEKILEPAAVNAIYDATLGTPRLINTLCDTAMTATAIRDLKIVTADCVTEVIEELGWNQYDIASRGVSSDDPLAPRLAVYHHDRLIHTAVCVRPVTVIGRCASNHLQIADQSISRRHALVSIANERFCIEDLGSKNGTFVNGKACDGRRLVLHGGDRIAVGHYHLIFQSPDPSDTLASESHELPSFSEYGEQRQAN